MNSRLMNEIDEETSKFVNVFTCPEYVKISDFIQESVKFKMTRGDTMLHEARIQYKGIFLGFNDIAGSGGNWDVRILSNPNAKYYVTNDNGTRWSYYKSDLDDCSLMKLNQVPKECYDVVIQQYNESLEWYKRLIKEKLCLYDKLNEEHVNKVKNNWLIK